MEIVDSFLKGKNFKINTGRNINVNIKVLTVLFKLGYRWIDAVENNILEENLRYTNESFCYVVGMLRKDTINCSTITEEVTGRHDFIFLKEELDKEFFSKFKQFKFPKIKQPKWKSVDWTR